MFSAIGAYVVTLTGSPSAAIASVAWTTAAAPAMSHFMVFMPCAGLMRQAAGVERDALADQREVGLGALGGVGQLDQPRRRARAGADAEDAAAAELGELLLVVDHDLDLGRRPGPCRSSLTAVADGVGEQRRA